MSDATTSGAPAVGALDAWRRVVGSENVLTDVDDLDAAATATFATTQRIAAIVRPASLTEVEACVRVANQYRVPIYPISRGRNWGLGSRVPVRTESVLLDLGRLDRIVDFDEKLGYITVQPGVTFRQVDEFLRERKSRLFAAVTGGPPDGSLIGNALERGDGAGPYGDRAAHVCGLEVVLPSGETIRTGFRRFANATTSRLSRSGVGPFLDGLFIQSNLGIVTELTVWLHPRPKYLEKFVVPVDDTADLAELIDAIQPLVLGGTIGAHSFGLWNAYKVMAVRGRYPWQATGHRTPLSLRDLGGREPWSAGGALYAASASQRTAGRKLIKEALAGLPCAPTFESVRDRPEAGGRKHARGTEDLWWGVPTARNLRSMYWRKKSDPTGWGGFDPHRHQCGVIWLHPTLPFSGAHVVRAALLMQTITAAHGFEPQIGMSCASGRIINVYISLMYDREVAGEDERAMACHDELLERLMTAGYPPYRLGLQSMRAPPASGSAYEETLHALKSALDPNDILAPGRYDFRHDGKNPRSSGIERATFNPAACLRHLAAHREAFHIGDSAALTHFSALIGEAESATIECSCKVEGERVHPARFNLWFQQRPSEEQMGAALRFLARVEASVGVALDYEPFRRFYGAGFDWARTEALVVGIDLREKKADSRLKIWFKLGQYPEKEEEAFLLANDLQGDSGAELRPLMVRPGFLVGFDFTLDGRAAIKLYARMEQVDLKNPATRARLASALSPAALARMDACAWGYVSLARNGGGRSLHFRPTDPASFIPGLLGDDRVERISEHHRHEDLLDTVVSVRERDLSASRIQDFNLYSMLGAREERPVG